MMCNGCGERLSLVQFMMVWVRFNGGLILIRRVVDYSYDGRRQVNMYLYELHQLVLARIKKRNNNNNNNKRLLQFWLRDMGFLLFLFFNWMVIFITHSLFIFLSLLISLTSNLFIFQSLYPSIFLSSYLTHFFFFAYHFTHYFLFYLFLFLKTSFKNQGIKNEL